MGRFTPLLYGALVLLPFAFIMVLVTFALLGANGAVGAIR